MRTGLLIALVTAVVLAALATMNNACKSSRHTWCAPVSEVQRHDKAAPG